jgi:hypothetical protein
MKVTEVGWRGTIGRFRNRKFKTKSVVLVNLTCILSVALICTLLIIGGVEVNPGPSPTVSKIFGASFLHSTKLSLQRIDEYLLILNYSWISKI